jgi:hypothetical protein
MSAALGWLLIKLGMLLGVFGLASTAGPIAPMPNSPMDVTHGGGIETMALGAGVSGATLVSGTSGRLQNVLVTTSAAQSWTFYDSNDPTKTSGKTIIGLIPASTAAGTVVRFQMPAALGIVAVPSGAGMAVTVSFN